ncbi:hypothetical protein [Azospirillum sp. B4]|uniref:hypothetical protein n=1 Tax=Azospirillum sp. B4 TaxID=95605 RepID=UPI0011DDC947|nr:hypothetical protein [Azospirillum sp. B4]
MGDSHVRYFRKARENGYFHGRIVSVCEVRGATAVGMRNPKSKSDALRTFRRVIAPLPRDSILLIHLGEVDCGYLIWCRAQEYGETIEQQMTASLAAYDDFVGELQSLGFTRIILSGATLPAIADNHAWGEVAMERRQVHASLRERTDLTLRYNEALRDMATRRGLRYADITADLLDPETGVLRPDYRHRDLNDHHLDNDRAALCWNLTLAPLLIAYDLEAAD